MRNLTRKSMLLASAAVVVMSFGVAKPALAFDEVNWAWDKNVLEEVALNVNANIDVAPSGMVEIEKLQAHIGDVTATSTVTGFTNNPPGEGAEAGPAPAPSPVVIDLQAYYDDNLANNPVTQISLLNGNDTGMVLSNGTGQVDNNNEQIFLTFDLTDTNPAPGPVPIAIGERDGIDLPEVSSVATAVGNNQNIESSAALTLHDGQFLLGGFAEGEGNGTLDTFLASGIDSGNTYTDIAGGMALAGALGLITPATVSADSTVTGILNASVNSEATAVGNNMSVDLAAFTPDDAFMIADVTQVAYADVTATSLVDDVTVEGYTGLGAAGFGVGEGQVPIINSVATAVGNNFSVTVSSPDL